jgi:hypothetical protein
MISAVGALKVGEMPNGGSDCCATCWFNRNNHGEAGYAHAGSAEPAYCEIRHLEIPDPSWTYCANHPRRSPARDRVPIGPVFIDPREEGREIWKESPDTEEVRTHLLDLLARIEEQPKEEYPIGSYRDEVVVCQLGELREQRASRNLERIANFDTRASTGAPLRRSRYLLVEAAKQALMKISGERQT